MCVCVCVCVGGSGVVGRIGGIWRIDVGSVGVMGGGGGGGGVVVVVSVGSGGVEVVVCGLSSVHVVCALALLLFRLTRLPLLLLL